MADTFPRINGEMIQSGRYAGELVSLVGRLTSHDQVQTADGVTVRLETGSMNEQPIVNPDMAVEIMGQPTDETTFRVRLYEWMNEWMTLRVGVWVCVCLCVCVCSGRLSTVWGVRACHLVYDSTEPID